MILGLGWVLPDAPRPAPALAALPDDRAAIVDGPDLGPWLRRRKDARLLPRTAQLALPAAGRAMQSFEGDPEELAIVVAVGREPPDEGEAEAALAAMHDAGALDLDRLRAHGHPLYPPLLPLRTLPNMVLAHVAIQHGIRGENAVFAGGPEAGRHAWKAACDLLREGRAPAVLVGAAYSAVDLASARDRLRLGLRGPPGEAAIFALLGGPAELPAPGGGEAHPGFGDLGPVTPLLGLVTGERATLAAHGQS